VWALAAVAAAGLVFALAMVLGGGAPQAPPPGLSAPGRVPAWVGHVVGFGGLLAGVVAVGLGTLATPWIGRRELAGPAAAAAAGWVSVTVLQLGVRAWQFDAHGGLFVGAKGEALVMQGLLAVVAAVGWTVASDAPGRGLALPAALGALLPVVLVGHSRAAADPLLAGTAVAVHVVAAAVWVGGLGALAWVATRPGESWRRTLPRYSWLALVSALALAASGVVAALGQIALDDVLSSRYGALIALKAVALTGLAVAGWLQRRHVVPRVSGSRQAFLALATLELTTMALTLALAAALAHTPPPA
jgi:putative copper resistance protein D